MAQIINLTSNTLVYNIMNYGGVADGTTDNVGAFNAACAAAGSVDGNVYIPGGDYALSDTVVVPANVNLVGEHSLAVNLISSANDVCIRYGNDGSFYNHGMRLSGFKITGNSGTAACGIETGDSYNLVIDDVVVDDFTGGVGIRFYNKANWTEGMQMNSVRVRNCAEGVTFDRDATSDYPSFGYGNIRGLSINVPDNGVGIRVGAETGTAECWLYNTRLEAVFWLGSTATAIRVPGNGLITADVMLTGEAESGAADTTFIDCDGGFTYTGSMWIDPTSFTNNFVGSVTPRHYNVMPVSSGTSVVPGIMAGPPYNDQLHAGFGFVSGPNEEYPVAWGYNYGGSKVFQFSARNYSASTNDAWNANDGAVAEITADGDMIVYGGAFVHGDSGIYWWVSSGSPEGVLSAPVGSMYSRTDGGTNTTLYVKESGTGNTGWVAK